MKKTLTVLLAVFMMLSLAVSALAAQTGSLTINGTVEGKSYDLYKVFDLTQADDNYSYTVNSDFAGYFTANSIDDPVAYVGALTGSDVALLARDLLDYAVTNKVPAAATVTGEAASTTVDGLEYGYYLLNPKGASGAASPYATMFSLNTLSGNNTEITMKAEYPTIDKTVNEVKVNGASVGDILDFKLTSSVPDMTGYNRYYFIINDKLSKGLTFQEITSVTVGEKVLSADNGDYVLESVTNEDGTTSIRIIFHNFLENYKDNEGDAIVVEYTAQLNDKALIGGANENEADIIYSNDPTYEYKPGDVPDGDTPVGETPKSTTETYTTSLTINKIDSEGNALKGAEFQITGDNVNIVLVTTDAFVLADDGEYWLLKDGTYTLDDPAAEGMDQSLYASITDKYSKTTTTSVKEVKGNGVDAKAFVGDDGKVTFAGLGAGTYTVTETTVPNGYNKIEPFNVVITFDPVTKTFSATATNGNSVAVNDNLLVMDVVNQSGTILPSTGGIGTTIFYIVGGILVVGAVVLLITRKRVSSDK